MVIYILLIFISITPFNAEDVDESAENKYINSLPEKEKRDFLEKVARRILEEVESKEVEVGLASGEIHNDKLNVHGEYVKKLLKEEIENLKRRNQEKNNSDILSFNKTEVRLLHSESPVNKQVLRSEGNKQGTEANTQNPLENTTLRSPNATQDETSTDYANYLHNENKKDKPKQKDDATKKINKKEPVSIEITFVNDEDENLKKSQNRDNDEIPVNVVYDDKSVKIKSILNPEESLPETANEGTIAHGKNKKLFRKSFPDVDDNAKNIDNTFDNQIARKKRKSNSETDDDMERNSTLSNQTKSAVETYIVDETGSLPSGNLNLKSETITGSPPSSDLNLKSGTTTEGLLYQDNTSTVNSKNSTQTLMADNLQTSTPEKNVQQSQDDDLEITTAKDVGIQTIINGSKANENKSENAILGNSNIMMQKMDTTKTKLISGYPKESYNSTSTDDADVNIKYNNNTTENPTTEFVSPVEFNFNASFYVTKLSDTEITLENRDISTNKSEFDKSDKFKPEHNETVPTSTINTIIKQLTTPKIEEKKEIVAMEASVEILDNLTMPKSHNDKKPGPGETFFKQSNSHGSSTLKEYIVFEMLRNQQPFVKKEFMKGQSEKGNPKPFPKMVQYVPNQNQSLKEEQPSQVEQPYYAPVYNYAPEFAYFNPKNKYEPNLDDEVKIVDERSHEMDNIDESEKLFDYDIENRLKLADGKKESEIDHSLIFLNELSKPKVKTNALVRTATKDIKNIKIPEVLRKKIREHLKSLEDRFAMAVSRSRLSKNKHKNHPFYLLTGGLKGTSKKIYKKAPVILLTGRPHDDNKDDGDENAFVLQTGRLNDYMKNDVKKTNDKEDYIKIFSKYINNHEINKTPLHLLTGRPKNREKKVKNTLFLLTGRLNDYAKQGNQKLKNKKDIIQKLSESYDNLDTGSRSPKSSESKLDPEELKKLKTLNMDTVNMITEISSQSNHKHLQNKNIKKSKNPKELYSPTEEPPKGYNAIEKFISNERDMEPYVTAMIDLIQTNSTALKNYNWLSTTIDIRSALVKLLKLCENVQNEKDIHQKDVQLLKYVLYLYSTTKFLFDDQIMPLPSQKTDLKSSSLKNKKEKVDVRLNPKILNLKDSLEIYRENLRIKIKRHKAKRRSQYSSRRIMQRPWLNKRGLKDMAVDIRDFIDDLGSVLYEFHNAIQHISLVTSYRKQRWFENLQEVYLSSPPTRKQALEIILHLETTNLIDLIENSAASGLVKNYVKYGLDNPAEVEKTKEEFAFVVKLYLELKKLQ
ncbi:hypothetical protein O0L34_g13309 [Tuta absoluta]|nr:hypothetical protein O0L34_g13309 [Tuta absoluta]